MYLWLQIFLLATGITARLIISSSIAGSGLNLLINIFIWLAFLIYFLEKSRLSAETSTLPSFLKLLLFLFVALIIASFINAPYKFGAFQYLVAWLSDIVLFYLVYSLCVRDAKYITTLLSVFLSTALIVVFYALYQHFWELRGLVAQIQQNPSLLDMVPVDLRNDFLARALAAEPFATFTYQNSLGAFLILVIPLFIAMLFLGRRIILIITGVMALVLLKTSSKGAIISSLISQMFMIYYLPSRFSKSARILLVIVILALSILTGILGYSQMSGSLNARLGYWDATVKIIRDNSWNGVGLNQFGNSYLYYKSAIAGEVTKAHNDYLQIAAEMGIPALIIFLAIWFIVLKSIFRPPRVITATDCPPHTPRTLTGSLSKNQERVNYVRGLPYILGAGFAFLISEVFQTPLTVFFDVPFVATIIFFLLWLVAFRLLSGYLTTCPVRNDSSGCNKDRQTGRGTLVGNISNGLGSPAKVATANILNINILRIGLFAGLVAFLIHCLVDFNFYVQGLSMSVWFVGAIFLSTTESTTPLSFLPRLFRRDKLQQGSRVMTILLAMVTITIIILLCVGAVKLVEYEFLLDYGKLDIRNGKTESGTKSLFLANHINPYAVEPLLELSRWYHYGSSSDKTDVICVEYIDKAISLNPLASMLYYQQGGFYLEHAEQERKNGRAKMATIYEQRAKRSFQTVKELYPTYRMADDKK